MDKKIAIPFGFALMLVMAVAGMMALFNITATSPAEASIIDTSKDFRANIDPLKVTGAPATVVLTGAGATVSPNDPGALTRMEVRFQTTAGAANDLFNGVDTIVITLHDEFQVPPSIDRNNVSIAATAVTGAVGSPNAAVAPQAVTVDFVGTENNEPELTITVPDMDPDDNTGGNGIAGGATVTVIFPQSAGIRNPTEADDDFNVNVRTSKEPTDASVDITIPAIIELSSTGDPRNEEITLVGKGFKNATTLTFWRDGDGDGARDSGELDLCSAVVGSDDVGTCNFTVTNPPFDPGAFGTGGECTFLPLPLALVDCNFVNGIDGRSNVSTIADQGDVDRQVFELEGLVSASPSTGDPGDTLTIQLRDFPQGNVTDVTVGGVAVAGVNQAVPATGELNFTIDIPNGVPTGTQALAVREPVTNSVRRTNIDIGGATVIPTPDTVVPNQRITLIGTGFTEGGNRTINEAIDIAPFTAPCTQDSSITIGGQPIADADINEGQVITIDNGGSWSASLDIPITSSTTVGGPRELKVVDCQGRDGTVVLNFPERQLEISPPEARVGTNVEVRGTGFPGRIQGSSVSVDILYDSAAGDRTTTATPDSSGNFSVTLQVPLEAAIPSTNTLRATFNDDNNNQVVTTVTHRVPRATISIEPTSGPPGTTVTLEAVGFRRFTPITVIEVGGTDVTPSPKPSTDANGGVTFEFIVPGLETGTQTVEMDVRNVTGSAGFTVTEAGDVTGVATDVTQAIEPLGDNLVRVFNFNNATKEWTFFDPRPEFSTANTLDDLSEGQPYFVRVTENQTVQLNGQQRNLTCVNPGTPEEDCWNLIVW